jgi:hypothetical protein
MKKLLLLLLLIVTPSIYSLDSSLSIGWQQKIVYLERETLEKAPLFIELSLSQDIGCIKVYGTYRNELEKAQSIYFNPIQDYYTVGVKVNVYKELTITVEHQCYHPVNPFNQNLSFYNGGHNTIYLTFKSK